ncbi:GNAT family N-acetyltransferase [Agrobacterium vitis]|uniref:GNAT family N-acetyltransferase n=1 Tax=Agrobacterium vitis TaxID=373 RepID=UPI001573EB7D|nr:GNAT family N-acetyltransferase [Agrobacterium vitis]NSZ19884.1 GNAT family N-acetyltransferase [Agrobacterium vitis]QZO07213.1 GNAT family N-acetyltransferase [Agrobacterium vitis]UJL91118.1 GNAT family N-acetyltransferase [Agrobacterium vitis]
MEAKPLLIRCISHEDIDAFRRIRLEALACEPASFASPFEDWERLSDGDWQQRLQDHVFIAFSDDEPVGIMGLSRLRPKKMAHRATLVMVYVRKRFRGTGLSRKLLGAVIDFAKAKGILQIELGVSAENLEALRFYRRNGFTDIGLNPRGVLDEGRAVDEVRMPRLFNEYPRHCQSGSLSR